MERKRLGKIRLIGYSWTIGILRKRDPWRTVEGTTDTDDDSKRKNTKQWQHTKIKTNSIKYDNEGTTIVHIQSSHTNY